MSIKEKLQEIRKRVKSLVLTGALVTATVAAPVKGQARDKAMERMFPSISNVSERKQEFEQAVRAGAPKEEIAKYIYFPEFIPVTQNGQFDGKKADEYAKALLPYVKTLAEKGETVSGAEAYQAFKKATGQKEVTWEDFEAVREMARRSIADQKSKPIDATRYALGLLIVTGLTLAAGFGAYKAGEAVAKDVYSSFKYKRFDLDVGPVIGLVVAGALSALCARGAINGAGDVKEALTRTPEKTMRWIYEGTYNNYLKYRIEDKQKQLKQSEWERAKKVIEKAALQFAGPRP